MLQQAQGLTLMKWGITLSHISSRRGKLARVTSRSLASQNMHGRCRGEEEEGRRESVEEEGRRERSGEEEGRRERNGKEGEEGRRERRGEEEGRRERSGEEEGRRERSGEEGEEWGGGEEGEEWGGGKAVQEEEEEASCRCITSAELEDSSLSLETCSRAAISSHKARAEKCLQMGQPQRRVRGVMVWVRM